MPLQDTLMRTKMSMFVDRASSLSDAEDALEKDIARVAEVYESSPPLPEDEMRRVTTSQFSSMVTVQIPEGAYSAGLETLAESIPSLRDSFFLRKCKPTYSMLTAFVQQSVEPFTDMEAAGKMLLSIKYKVTNQLARNMELKDLLLTSMDPNANQKADMLRNMGLRISVPDEGYLRAKGGVPGHSPAGLTYSTGDEYLRLSPHLEKKVRAVDPTLPQFITHLNGLRCLMELSNVLKEINVEADERFTKVRDVEIIKKKTEALSAAGLRGSKFRKAEKELLLAHDPEWTHTFSKKNKAWIVALLGWLDRTGISGVFA